MIDVNVVTDKMELQAVREVLRETAAHIPDVRDGHCGYCGEKRYVTMSETYNKFIFGPCPNRGCLSHRIARALADDTGEVTT
jgi:hypothetical protein